MAWPGRLASLAVGNDLNEDLKQAISRISNIPSSRDCSLQMVFTSTVACSAIIICFRHTNNLGAVALLFVFYICVVSLVSVNQSLTAGHGLVRSEGTAGMV